MARGLRVVQLGLTTMRVDHLKGRVTISDFDVGRHIHGHRRQPRVESVLPLVRFGQPHTQLVPDEPGERGSVALLDP